MERGLLVARIFDAVRGPRSGASSGRCPLGRDALVAGLLLASALLAGAAVPALADRGATAFGGATWRALGGTGAPADAPEWRQDRLALRLYRQSGTAPWPNCP